MANQYDNRVFSVFRKSLVVILGVAVVASTGFGVGYVKGASSCKSINIAKARKSLKLTQEASRSTAKFNLDQQALISNLKSELKEVHHECLSTPMPNDLIDLLNQ